MTNAPGDLSLSRDAEAVSFWIHVTPRARRPRVGGRRGDALRVAVGAPPLEGRANAACAEALAEALGVRPAAVWLEPGSRGRRKRVRVEGQPEQLAERLRRLAESGALG